MNANAILTEVFRATWHWMDIVSQRGELATGDYWDDETACAAISAAGYDADDLDSSVSQITEVSPRHSLLRPGDLAVSNGYGTDWVFFRVIA